ncbi:adenosylhomocysteinase [Legionella lansingensis]|uniref:Adenosylhomocysteinase n=1 Tax=Legionella lansingensis TaxID=45067 RepID=A0A0W0VWA3_9GAMM|nr:NAD(P)-dependent oxidoreductase [Legionella lansingensis]KTD24367.1 adenosylhomocysteinase [Legionella lansingensis]SNV51655.1 adenosylhomocysteinase [Legionella lansingensis]
MVSDHNLSLLIQHNLKVFPDTHTYLLRDLRDHWATTKPLAGIKLLHNIPVTYETLVKLESLLAAGAELTVVHPKFLETPPAEEIIGTLANIGVHYVKLHQDVEGEFDIALDCCAEVPNMPKVKVRKGIAELTQSGGEQYRQMNTPFPVINIDESNLKKLEGMYGTGEAFTRAIKERTEQSIKNLRFMVFGFGKVGRGIVKYLLKETPHITVVEQSPYQLQKARELGVEALDIAHLEEVKRRAKEMFCLVTATGQPQLLSKYLSPEDCPQAIIANMGASDEIGLKFNHKKILCSHMPINFSLKHPTLLHFIDPVFYAHNLTAQLLLENNYAAGYHPFPSYLDELIIRLWNTYNPMDISDIFNAPPSPL